MILISISLSTKQIDSFMDDKEDETLENSAEKQFTETLDTIAAGVGVNYLPKIKEVPKSI